MTARETERLTRVEEKQSDMQVRQIDMSSEIAALRQDVKDIKTTLDNLSGGKQALMWITGITLTVMGLLLALYHETKK